MIICRTAKFYIINNETRYTRKATTHATAVLYAMLNSPQRHEPLSREMAVTVAIHGQYSRINTMNAKADAGVKSG